MVIKAKLLLNMSINLIKLKSLGKKKIRMAAIRYINTYINILKLLRFFTFKNILIPSPKITVLNKKAI